MSVSLEGRADRTRKVVFQSSGTWTVPAGVFWAEAEVVGGGSGRARNNDGTAGTDTTVAFTGGTITGEAMGATPTPNAAAFQVSDAPANSGESALVSASGNYLFANGTYSGGPGSWTRPPVSKVRAGASVTPGASITITVGAGGSATGDGGSGYAIIYYEV